MITVFLAFLALIPTEIESQLLYLIHKKELKTAFTTYQSEQQNRGGHDYSFLQKAALTLLEEGINSGDEEVQFLSLIGAGVSLNKGALSILKKGLESDNGSFQMLALNFLAELHEDEGIALLKEALSSPFLLIRLKAALMLAEKQENIVVDHLLSLYGKIPKEAKVLYPQILVHIDTPASTKFLKNLLSETETNIRLATLHYTALAKRDDLLPSIRSRASHPDYAESEAAAFALGMMNDSDSKQLLQKMRNRPVPEVKLAALYALYCLGEEETAEEITAIAALENGYAITLLGELPSTPKMIAVLKELQKSASFDIRLNASLSLLKLKEKSALAFFEPLFSEERDLGFAKVHSFGKSLHYWKTHQNLSQKKEKMTGLEGESLGLKELVAIKAIELPEEDFLDFTKRIFEKEQKSDLIPILVTLLSNHKSEKSITLLKEKMEEIGAPKLRAYATLALYRMTHEKEYEKRLLKFISQEKEKALIIKAPDIKEIENVKEDPYHLTSGESSAFLLQAFDAIGTSSRTAALDTLLDAMANGNPKNAYALAGLLLRMTE